MISLISYARTTVQVHKGKAFFSKKTTKADVNHFAELTKNHSLRPSRNRFFTLRLKNYCDKGKKIQIVFFVTIMPSDRRLWYVEEKHAVTFCPLTLLQIWHNKRMMCTERNKKVTVKRISVTVIIGNYKVSQHYL